MDLLKWIQHVRILLSYLNDHSKAFIVKGALNNQVDKIMYPVNVSLLLSSQLNGRINKVPGWPGWSPQVELSFQRLSCNSSPCSPSIPLSPRVSLKVIVSGSQLIALEGVAFQQFCPHW